MAISKTLQTISFLFAISFVLNFQSLYPVDDAILYKSCVLSFEQHDTVGAMTRVLRNCIAQKVISIVVPQVLWKMKFDEDFQESYQSGKIIFLASEFTTNDGLPQLIVIVPASLEDLGINIAEPNKQKKEALVASAIASKYGFKNLYLLKPEFGWPIIEKVNQALMDELHEDSKNFPKIIKRDSPELKEILKNFPNIIDKNSPQHPTRFYFAGHGGIGEHIAGVPINDFEIVLSDFSEIDSEFVYLVSCFAAGNIPEIQKGLTNIVTKQIEERKKSKAAPFPGIDYAIVVEAAGEDKIYGHDVNIRAMFIKLDKFLEDPVWALEFGPTVMKPMVTITDVILALGPSGGVSSKPSIRFPGKTGYFRPLDVETKEFMNEIITESKVIELGVEKILKLVSESKSSDKNIADAAKKKLAGLFDIEIVIKPEIQTIQIFPMDLLDFTFVLQGSKSLFWSKLMGKGQHYIGKIVDKVNSDIQSLISARFFMLVGYITDHCWFIKFVDMQKSATYFKKLVIHIYTAMGPKGERLTKYCDYAYINEKGESYIAKKRDDVFAVPGVPIQGEFKTNKNTFESTIREWFQASLPSQETLTEATGGVEITAEEKARLLQEKGGAQALKLIEPKFARTPQDLFNMFMAD